MYRAALILDKARELDERTRRRVPGPLEGTISTNVCSLSARFVYGPLSPSTPTSSPDDTILPFR